MYEIGNMPSAIHGGRTDTSYGMSDFVSVRRTHVSPDDTAAEGCQHIPNIWSGIDRCPYIKYKEYIYIH